MQLARRLLDAIAAAFAAGSLALGPWEQVTLIQLWATIKFLVLLSIIFIG